MTTLTKDQELLAESLNESVIKRMAEVSGLSVTKIKWLITTDEKVNAFFKETRGKVMVKMLSDDFSVKKYI
mgnify:CR=1 FL=1